MMVSSTYVAGEGLPSRELAASAGSAVSWPAIFAGALAAGVLSLLLFILGIGLGLSSVSVWSGKGSDGSTIAWGAIIWVVVTQLASAGVGGYIAGRLRTRWQGVHTDEVYFRDTVHGFLSWSFATILMVALMGSAVGSALTGTVKAAGSVVSGAASVAGSAVGAVTDVVGGAASATVAGAAGAAAGDASGDSGGLHYWVGSLFRNGKPNVDQKQIKDDARDAAQKARSVADATREVSGIFVYSLKNGTLSDEDAQYVASLMAQNTDLSTDEAKQKVQKTFDQIKQQLADVKQKAQEAEEKAKQAAETARKAAAYSMLWVFVSLMVGAFVASLSATWGGRMRDA